MSRHDRFLVWITVFIVALLIAGSCAARADAHVVTGAQCGTYGRMHQFTTGRDAAPWAAYCRKQAHRHLVAHATTNCVAMSSAMLPKTCSAIAWQRTPWATDIYLHRVIRYESNFNPNAVNRDSGACGLFQLLPCPWESDSRTVYATQYVQVGRGVRYISGRYGSPAAAWNHIERNGWY